MSKDFEDAIATGSWEYTDYEEADISYLSDAYTDYICAENYYDQKGEAASAATYSMVGTCPVMSECRDNLVQNVRPYVIMYL